MTALLAVLAVAVLIGPFAVWDLMVRPRRTQGRELLDLDALSGRHRAYRVADDIDGATILDVVRDAENRANPAWNARHQLLRTGVLSRDGEPLGVITYGGPLTRHEEALIKARFKAATGEPLIPIPGHPIVTTVSESVSDEYLEGK